MTFFHGSMKTVLVVLFFYMQSQYADIDDNSDIKNKSAQNFEMTGESKTLLFYFECDSLVKSIMIHKSIIEVVQTACTFISRLLVFIEQLCVKIIIY